MFFTMHGHDQPPHPDTVLDHAATLAPHLAQLLRRFGDDRPRILSGDTAAILAEADDDLTAAINATRDDTALMAAIRQYRGRVNHVIAVTDFLDQADVVQHMQWLTHAAEHALSTLTTHLAGDDNHQWFMLALGKMGAGELNYSSDIDLIIITLNDYDDYTLSKRFITLTRRIIALMSTPTKDGIGWRIDLRLRPDPGATPIAMHHGAAISYYESLARTWERAAFIRARPVAGNIDAGHQFLADLNPFIWRQYLDYTVLEDLKIMLRREPRAADLLGYNIKNGFGGIRSIEFFVHAQQLIAGGREKTLRHRLTNDALDALAQNKWISPEAAARLKQSYLTWRRLEHRLQMVGDAQTHSLPKSDTALADFASLCGVDDPASFKANIIALGDGVHEDTKALMERLEQGQNAHHQSTNTSPELPSLTLSWEGEQSSQVQETLTALGYENPEGIISTMQGWLAGRIPATRSPRARGLLSDLLPNILTSLAEYDAPDLRFAAFARLVEKLPAGLQLFSLMQTHSSIASTIINIVSEAPKLADIISSHSILADNLLYRSFWQAEENWPGCAEDLMASLANHTNYEDHLLILRRTCREWQFRTSVQLLQGQITPQHAGQDFAAIADIIIKGALYAVSQVIEQRFGHIDNSGISILALGRLGAEEMTMISDLDLIFVYDGPPDALSSGGARQVGLGQYYARFGQELINALSALTPEGRCFDIDMRLRPSGNKGPISVHIDTFITYQDNEAWAWEHMALLKSRVIDHYGRDDISTRLQNVIPTLIKKDRDPAQLVTDVADMRARLQSAASASAAQIDIRSSSGGIMDIDLVTQMMQLMPQAAHLPPYRKARDAAMPLADSGLITPQEAQAIIDATQFYNDAIQLMRLLDMRITDEKRSTGKFPELLKKRFKINSFDEFSDQIKNVAKPISSVMKKYVSKAEKGSNWEIIR